MASSQICSQNEPLTAMEKRAATVARKKQEEALAQQQLEEETASKSSCVSQYMASLARYSTKVSVLDGRSHKHKALQNKGKRDAS
jgi:hypothetical protein